MWAFGGWCVPSSFGCLDMYFMHESVLTCSNSSSLDFKFVCGCLSLLKRDIEPSLKTQFALSGPGISQQFMTKFTFAVKFDANSNNQGLELCDPSLIPWRKLLQLQVSNLFSKGAFKNHQQWTVLLLLLCFGAVAGSVFGALPDNQITSNWDGFHTSLTTQIKLSHDKIPCLNCRW